MNQKHKLRSLGSRWFNCHLCLFRIECRVVLLLDSHCIKESGECNKDWITNNQYWWNWKKKIGFGWIMRTGETGETTWSKEENPTTNSTHIWRRRCGIWTRHCWKASALALLRQPRPQGFSLSFFKGKALGTRLLLCHWPCSPESSRYLPGVIFAFYAYVKMIRS